MDSDLPSRGDIVVFAKPFADEDPKQEYVLLDDPAELNPIDQNEITRVDIQALNTGLTFPGVQTVDVKALKVIKKLL